MNYKKIYQNIVSRARSRKKMPGLERHHVVPRSCGGTDDPENLVFLTTREHFVCHMLLVRIYKHNPDFRKKMVYALWWMSKSRHNLNDCRVTSHTYEFARQQFIKENPNKCEIRKRQFSENHKNGKYNYDYDRVSNTMKNTLSSLSKEEMIARMKKSALSCDQEERSKSIRKGKGSHLKLTYKDGTFITFWSYDDVLGITGYRYDQIRYRLKTHNGLLENGNTVEYITRYQGNDKNIGRKRDNCI